MQNKEQKKIWEKVYKDFKEHNLTISYIHDKIERFISHHLDREYSILEAGCGSGTMVAKFQDHCELSMGLDYQWEPLRISRDLFNSETLVMGDLFSLPFKDSSIDIVWNAGVLEHFSHEISVKACSEMARAARRYVVINVPNRCTLFTIRKILLRVLGKWPYGFERSFTRKKLKSTLSESGLKVIGELGIFCSPPLYEISNYKAIFAPFGLTIPLTAGIIRRLLNMIDRIEHKIPTIPLIFGYQLVMIGEKSESFNKQ
ncbi:class I SAM-dependent methyltransferase [bacterium]|nr:class I SAM-dependent methyltransferase [bacterium]